MKLKCLNCSYEMSFDCTPFIPGNYLGEPGSCYPSEGGEVEGPDECPECGEKVDKDKVFRKFEKQ